jgi:hypothetical protein
MVDARSIMDIHRVLYLYSDKMQLHFQEQSYCITMYTMTLFLYLAINSLLTSLSSKLLTRN